MLDSIDYKECLNIREDAVLSLLEEIDASFLAALSDQGKASAILKTLQCSQYVFKQVQSHPDYLYTLSGYYDQLVNQEAAWDKPAYQLKTAEFITQALELIEKGKQLGKIDSNQVELQLDKGLRLARQYFMLRWILADANRLITSDQLVKELSIFAGVSLDVASDVHHQILASKHGEPIGNESQQALRMVILAMGKLGASELNLSSDIDLMFCFSESGRTEGVKGRQQIENQQFFLKLGQKIIKSIDRVTADGFVFRVDMRLRPWGQSGALALSFDAMEYYYEQHGREWERFAMIKGNPIAGDLVAGEALMQRLKPFVFRRYTDFSAIQALRDMKSMINREVRRKGKDNDVKLGFGGIREIEFIAQAFQIIYGGRDDALQNRSVIKVLSYLEQAEILSQGSSSELIEAYWFLRNAEHAIQALDDQQTQRLPTEAEGIARFLSYLNFESSEAFNQAFECHRDKVRNYFSLVVADPIESENELDEQAFREAWLSHESDLFEAELADLGFQSNTISTLSELRFSNKLVQLQTESLERVNAFMPVYLQGLKEVDVNDQFEVNEAALQLVYAVLRRSSYLVLLQENPLALERLFMVAKASPWVMEQLVQHPVLLDELLTVEGLGQVPDVESLKSELQVQGLRIAIDDQEEQMQMLRYFKLAHHVHIVAAEASGKLPLMKVSDYLTWLAEAVLAYVLDLAFQQMVEKFGNPCSEGQVQTQAEFAIIGYGKLGGIELSHSSDLDLVFVYNADDQGQTDGQRSIDNRSFFTKLGQRVLSLLNTRTMMGQLYEIDMRLRPSGGKGLLVSSLKAFEKYQRESAWTWEHQALVRARAVAGSEKVIGEYNRIRESILSQVREREALAKDVSDMRQKMADNLIPNEAKGENAELFHLKHSRGGMVDIEFMVQFGVLARSAQFPELVRYTDNIRILETLAEVGLIQAEVSDKVIEAYQVLRAKGHALALKNLPSLVPIKDIEGYRDTIINFWQLLFVEGTLGEDIS